MLNFTVDVQSSHLGWPGLVRCLVVTESEIPLQRAVADETAVWEHRNLCAGQYVRFRPLVIWNSTFLSWTSALGRLRSAALLCPVNCWIQDVFLRCPPWDYKHTKLHGFLITKRRESWNTALIYEILSTEQNGSEQSGSEISVINLFVHWKKTPLNFSYAETFFIGVTLAWVSPSNSYCTRSLRRLLVRKSSFYIWLKRGSTVVFRINFKHVRLGSRTVTTLSYH